MRNGLINLVFVFATASSLADGLPEVKIFKVDVIKEKAGFSLGMPADEVSISNVRRADNLTVKFNAQAKGRAFQCYYTGAGEVSSDALCSPLDGQPMPASMPVSPLYH
ncbi:hypothetical protein [Chromobacterium subtsugae]|uniref:hypothetical protein n=1 Tax=Chromobacterium subtsugae TaxID=251747 RepID=UPI0012FF941C|nr:hypothetical protein [Chromobacterium subtsugae]